MSSGPSLKLLAGVAIMNATLSTPVSAQQTSDNELSETLSWMDNSYNPHPDGDSAWGRGRTGRWEAALRQSVKLKLLDCRSGDSGRIPYQP